MKILGSFVLLLSFIESALAVQGACVYQQPIPRVRCQVTTAQNCRIIHGKHFPGKTCKQVQQDNSSSAQVTIPQFGQIIAQARRLGRASGHASFTATDQFHPGSSVAGTRVFLQGSAQFELTRVSPFLFKIRSLQTQLEASELQVGRLPLHLTKRARELFASLAFTQFSFTGTLRVVGNKLQLTLTQQKTFLSELVTGLGSVESQSTAIFPVGVNQFHLKTSGKTYHPLLVDTNAFPISFFQ